MASPIVLEMLPVSRKHIVAAGATDYQADIQSAVFYSRIFLCFG